MFGDTAGQVPGQKVTAEYQGPRENPGLQEQSRDIAHDLRSKESPKESNGLQARIREANQDARTGFVCLVSHF